MASQILNHFLITYPTNLSEGSVITAKPLSINPTLTDYIDTAFITVSSSYGSASGRITLIQHATDELSYTYGAISAELSYAKINGGGGTVFPQYSYKQLVTASDGSTFYVTSDATLTFTFVSAIGSSASIDENGYVTADENPNDDERLVGTVTMVVELNGVTTSVTADVYQYGATTTYTYTITGVELNYDIIPVEGGTVDPELNITYTITNDKTGEVETVTTQITADTTEIDSVDIEINFAGAVVDTETGSVTWDIVNETTEQVLVDTVTVTVVFDGISSASATTDVYQEAGEELEAEGYIESIIPVMDFYGCSRATSSSITTSLLGEVQLTRTSLGFSGVTLDIPKETNNWSFVFAEIAYLFTGYVNGITYTDTKMSGDEVSILYSLLNGATYNLAEITLVRQLDDTNSLDVLLFTDYTISSSNGNSQLYLNMKRDSTNDATTGKINNFLDIYVNAQLPSDTSTSRITIEVTNCEVSAS